MEYLTDSFIILSRHLKKVFKQGWAMRPKKGQMYGKPTVHQLFRKMLRKSLCDCLEKEQVREARPKSYVGRTAQPVLVYPNNILSKNEIRVEISHRT